MTKHSVRTHTGKFVVKVRQIQDGAIYGGLRATVHTTPSVSARTIDNFLWERYGDKIAVVDVFTHQR